MLFKYLNNDIYLSDTYMCLLNLKHFTTLSTAQGRKLTHNFSIIVNHSKYGQNREMNLYRPYTCPLNENITRDIYSYIIVC